MTHPPAPEWPDRWTHDGLELRPVTAEDAAVFWTMDSDPEVMRYVQPPDEDRDAHARRLADGLSSKRFRHLRVIEDAADGDVLGWVFLRPTADGRWLELGYRLLPAAWGRGVATRASRAMIEVADRQGVSLPVMAQIMPGNRRSRRVAEKLGLQFAERIDDQGVELERWIRPEPPGGEVS